MCRYAEQDQPRPRRCTELRSPCDQCAAEEQAKMDELGAEQAERTMRELHFSNLTSPERTRHETF